MTGLLLAAVVIGAIGIIIGVLLGIASEKFKVEVDEKEILVRAELPGNNCGGCGFPGCDGLAAAIAAGTAPVNGCPVGGAPVADKIAAIMGVESGSSEKKVAFVKACAYGCMGYGSCVKACQFDAIHVVDGVAVVDKEKCVACGKCVATCPKGLIELVPYKAEHLVQCSSHDKGPAVKKVCTAGCIGCTLCTKQCEFDAIHMENNVAVIDYEKCTNCGKCAAKCPAKVIQ